MQKKLLYTVYDKITENYGPLFEQVNDPAAIRAFKKYLDDTPCPEDQQLYRVGYVDTNDENQMVVTGCDNFMLCDGNAKFKKEMVENIKQVFKSKEVSGNGNK